MDALTAIAERRSIRKFKDTPVDEETIRLILLAATQAPSGKNTQPWRFYVVQGEQRAEMVRVMREGMANLKAMGMDLGSAEWTVKIMERAPVTVFIFNNDMVNKEEALTMDDFFTMLVSVQSIGAAIQNMALAALDLGLGSLWIADILYAYRELCEWLEESHQMVAAMSFGYPDESPGPRPRKSMDEVTTWVK